MPYYFTRNDLDALDRKIREIQARMDRVVEDLGDSAQQGAETWHDNFGHEESMRQQAMWSAHLGELMRIKGLAKVVTPPPSGDEVLIGRTVLITDLDTEETREFEIGSFMVFDSGDRRISYAAPLAEIILGAKAGDVRSGKIGEKRKRFQVLSIR